MFTSLRKMEVMDEMKKHFENFTVMKRIFHSQHVMKDDLKRDIAFGQEEMKAVQEELKASLTSQLKDLLDEKLSFVKSKIDSVEIKVKERET